MPIYENSVIYKLVHKNDQDNENIYVGSTTNFRGRKLQHKRICCNEKNGKYNLYLYQFIRENGGWDEWEMIAVETYPCENKRELEIRERFYIETLKAKLNQIIPTRTHKEYREDNKELIKEKKKKEYEDNKEHIKERNLKYRQHNREKITEYNKEYRQHNCEKISEQRKQYRQHNRDKILEKTTCECGCILSRNHLNRHRNTDKHKKKMEALAN